jgi:tetratricopeptide (TPR) repeat protein
MEKYPASPLKSQVFSGEAECYARMGNLEQALKLYRTVIEGYPHSNFCETSLYRIGEILLEQLNLPDSAGFYFEWVKREFFNGVYGGKAGLALGECAVVAGNLPLAIGRYREMTGKAYLKQAEIVSEANLRLGRCFLWAEQADSAMTVWEELARKYPTSDAANDALNDILCIKETEDKNAVSAFAQAWYSAERRQYEAALKDFRALMERFPGTVIAGRSCVEAGNVLTKFQGAEFALSFIEDYINKNTEVKLKDQIYYQMGEICLNVLKEPVRARVYFEKLLVEMPDSPLAPVVRRKMEEKLLINL